VADIFLELQYFMEIFPKFKQGMKAVTQGGGRKSEITFFFTKPFVFPSNMKSTRRSITDSLQRGALMSLE